MRGPRREFKGHVVSQSPFPRKGSWPSRGPSTLFPSGFGEKKLHRSFFTYTWRTNSKSPPIPKQTQNDSATLLRTPRVLQRHRSCLNRKIRSGPESTATAESRKQKGGGSSERSKFHWCPIWTRDSGGGSPPRRPPTRCSARSAAPL